MLLEVAFDTWKGFTRAIDSRGMGNGRGEGGGKGRLVVNPIPEDMINGRKGFKGRNVHT